jgi:hypothetical protein
VGFPSAHHFRRLNGGGHRPEGGLDIYHHPFPQPRGGTHPHAGNFEKTLFIALANHGADLCRADIEADN